jgi:hypothetical protein
MTRTTKFMIGAMLLILLLASGCVYYFYYKYKNPPVTISNKAKDYVQAEAAIISKKVHKNGIEHTIADETKNLLPKNLVESEGLYDKAFVDSLIAETEFQKDRIVSLTQINQTITKEKLQATIVIDSLNRKKFEFQDNNLYLSYTPTVDPNVAGTFDYKYNQKLNIVSANDKKWFLGKDRYLTDISTNDKNSTINGVRTLRIAQPEKKFGATLTGKSVFFPQTGKFAVGSQLRVRYKSVTFTGAEYYFPASGKVVPAAGIEYDFLNYSR